MLEKESLRSLEDYFIFMEVITPRRSLVLAMRHCGYDNDITVWRRRIIAKPI